MNLQRLIAMIINVDKSITSDTICNKYFVSKDGKPLPYDEIAKFHTVKQLQWVHGQCKKIAEDYASILPPSAVKHDEDQDDIPF